MRKSFRMKKLVLLVLASFLSCMGVCGQEAGKSKVVMATIDFDYLQGCETGKGACKPIEIGRQSIKDSVIVIFPAGGTVTEVSLRSLSDKTVRLYDKKFEGQGKPTFSLTGLKDGEYTAGMISCGLGGSCVIRLKTNTE